MYPNQPKDKTDNQPRSFTQPVEGEENQPDHKGRFFSFLNHIFKHKGAYLLLVVALAVGTWGANMIIGSHADVPGSDTASADTTASTAVSAPFYLNLNDASNNEVALRWNPSTTPNVKYNVLRNGLKIGSTKNLSTNYLDSGLKPGTTYKYTVTAQLGSNVSRPTLPLAVKTAGSAIVVSTCGLSASSGNYVLTSNINYSISQNSACISANNVTNLSLNCQGHSITISGSGRPTFISMNNASNFMITNCKFLDTQPGIITYSGFLIDSGSYGTIANNTIGGSYSTYGNASCSSINSSSPNTTPLSVVNHNIVVANNNFVNSCLSQYLASYDYIGGNTLNWDVPTNLTTQPTLYSEPGNIVSGEGTHNVIAYNNMNGGSGTDGAHIGMDDSIILSGNSVNYVPGITSNDTIAYNTTSNNWDAGIETVGYIKDSSILRNNISNAFIAGISSYHNTSWEGNKVEYNKVGDVANSSEILEFYDYEAIPVGTKIYFQNNNFTGNVFNPLPNSLSQSVFINFTITENPTITSSNTVLGNNLIKNNNFGYESSMIAPYMAPTSMFVDGGGNICTVNEIPGAIQGALPGPATDDGDGLSSTATTVPSSTSNSGLPIVCHKPS